MAANTRVTVRNNNKSQLYDGPMNVAFYSKVGDLREMTLGYVQVIYSNHDASDGTFELFVSGVFCGDDMHFARYPCSLQQMSDDCPSLGWNLEKAGYRFFQIRYIPNSVTTGNLEIFAIGKKG